METPALTQIVAQVVPTVVPGSMSVPAAEIVRRAAVTAPVASTHARVVTAVVENKVHNP